MSGFALPIGRISTQQTSFALVNRLNADQASLQTLSDQLSSGQRLTQASDDPAAAVGIMRINQQVSANTQYSNNLSFATNALKVADSTLNGLSTLVSSAQSVASSMISTGTTADERTAEASVIDGYISQALSAANTQYQNQSLFGGSNSTQNAFVGAGVGYKYQGTNQTLSILAPGGAALSYTVDGSTAFGGVASQVGGGQTLTPALTANTKLSDLTGARSLGVSLGTVNVTAGATTVSVDLSQAATASDVVNIVNAGLTSAGSDATIAISGGGFVVNGDTTQSVTIADTTNNHTAADLGLAGTFPTTVVTPGGNVGPKVTATTPLSALNNGALDPSGFVITSGGKSATITLAGLNSVQDLVNAINGSGTNVTASISPDGTGIQINNAVSGVPVTIGENGGLTATQLGIRSMNAQTKLSDLNQGTGIALASANHSGATGNLVVTQTNGTQFTVKVDGISTQSQLISAINAAGGGTVTAALNATGNGITLTDTSGGGGNISVAGGSNYQSNNTDFGIIGQGTGAALAGTDATFSTDDLRITRQDGSTFTVNLTGASTIQDVLNKINGADGNTGVPHVSALLNANGNGIELLDSSGGGGALTVQALNGSSAAQQIGILKTATGSPASTIHGDDVNPVQPQGLFSSLIMLRNALLNNDTAGITQAGQLLQADGTRIIQANGIVGAQEQDLTQRTSAVTTEQTQLQSSLSLLQDTDMTTVITQFQQLQTAYQASLQIAAKQNTLSLMDFVQ